jgi:hypothetical protein
MELRTIPLTSSRKKPGVAFWTTVVVGCLLAYPLSFGPWCWIYSRSEELQTWQTADRIYYPILWQWAYGPDPVSDAIDWYANLWSAGEVAAGYPMSGSPDDLSIGTVQVE